jgi:hypothetical protein
MELGIRHCNSGLKDVCEQYCWFHYRQSPRKIIGLIGDLQLYDVTGGGSQFQVWLSGQGYLGFPWSNMVTLFMQLHYPESFPSST